MQHCLVLDEDLVYVVSAFVMLELEIRHRPLVDLSVNVMTTHVVIMRSSFVGVSFKFF